MSAHLGGWFGNLSIGPAEGFAARGDMLSAEVVIAIRSWGGLTLGAGPGGSAFVGPPTLS